MPKNGISDDDVLDVIHEQLTINVTGMDKSEEVLFSLVPWLSFNILHEKYEMLKNQGRPEYKAYI